MLGKSLIKELEQILREEYKKDFSMKEASEIACTLVNYFNLLTKINRREKIKNNYNNEKFTNKQTI